MFFNPKTQNIHNPLHLDHNPQKNKENQTLISIDYTEKNPCLWRTGIGNTKYIASSSLCLWHTGIGNTQYIASSRLNLMCTLIILVTTSGKKIPDIQLPGQYWKT